MKEVERLLREQYGHDFQDLFIPVLDGIEADLANVEEPQAIVNDIAEKEGLTKLAPSKSNETRALRIAMQGKRAEYDIYGNRINPSLNLGPVVDDSGDVIDDDDNDDYHGW
jgi:hypothetical protein